MEKLIKLIEEMEEFNRIQDKAVELKRKNEELSRQLVPNLAEVFELRKQVIQLEEDTDLFIEKYTPHLKVHKNVV